MCFAELRYSGRYMYHRYIARQSEKGGQHESAASIKRRPVDLELMRSIWYTQPPRCGMQSWYQAHSDPIMSAI